MICINRGHQSLTVLGQTWIAAVAFLPRSWCSPLLQGDISFAAPECFLSPPAGQALSLYAHIFFSQPFCSVCMYDTQSVRSYLVHALSLLFMQKRSYASYQVDDSRYVDLDVCGWASKFNLQAPCGVVVLLRILTGNSSRFSQKMGKSKEVRIIHVAPELYESMKRAKSLPTLCEL